MTVPELQPPERDRALGMGFYITRTPGVAGAVKSDAEDFRVREVSAYPMPVTDGPFTVLRIESRNWEQHELAEAIARRLGLPRRSLEWAGTKDRRAVSERLFSYRGAPPDRELGLSEVTVLDAYRATEGVRLGHHFGNAFDIRVRRLEGPAEESAVRFHVIRDELRRAGGFPNFFGPQRFGEVRPVTHEVGRALVRGDAAGAVDIYLTAVPVGEDGPGVAARRQYAADHDVSRALREFPREYRFERAILERLERGQPPGRALNGLARELRMLFVHAYQSLLFNRWISLRWRRGLPLTRPIVGDRILRLSRDGTIRGTDAIPVAPDNMAECSDLVERARAVVAGPLVGYGSPLPEGPAGELLQEVLAEEDIRPSDFALPAFPELASRGAYRPVVVALPPIGIAPEGAPADSVRFTFALPKGAYATVLLREFLKSGAG